MTNIVAQGLGAVGSSIGFFGNAALSASGFGVGFTVGFTSGFTGGFIGATLTSLANGNRFEDALASGFKTGLTSGLLAGLTAGIGAGVKARKAGGDFWSGKGATFDTLATPGARTEVGQDLEYSNEFAKDFSDKHFGQADGLNKLYADGTFPEGYTMEGGRVFNSNGQEILGVTKHLGSGQSNVYLAQKAFSSKELLYMTIKHEFIHVELINAGFGISQFGKAHHASIYRWKYEQSLEWGLKSFDYLQQAIKYEPFFNPAVDSFIPNILNVKPW